MENDELIPRARYVMLTGNLDEEKRRIRDMILLNGNRIAYRDLVQTYQMDRDVLDDVLREMNVDGDLFEPRFGELSVVV